ncbi:MAG: methylated-DNA--[protein]-cysteine S-methyltransferase [Candidatus Parcubacteria bacterium]|jgi:AraC family transcriptional regulator of adaptative response/methylated-DNA-[protein]-cysteine methyltransferase
MSIVNYSIHKSPHGKYILATTEKGISDISFFTGLEADAVVAIEREVLKRSKHVVFQRVNREGLDFNVKHKLDLHGTPFQLEVWKTLLKIKSGQTKTYSQVAEMMGQPNSVRAVASAIAKNNIAILIPCHRVLRNDGLIGEFRWGPAMKKQLLIKERAKIK